MASAIGFGRTFVLGVRLFGLSGFSELPGVSGDTTAIWMALDVAEEFLDTGRSTKMLRVTRDSVDENATVKVITVCTLVYLYASFMATFFGMNIFDYGPEVGGLRASPYSWVYVATTVPLTLLTVGGWYLFKLQHDKKRKKKRDEEEEAE